MGRNKNTMDPISLPDKDKIDQLDGGFVNSRRVYKEKGIDDFTNTVRADFNEAAPIKVPERSEEKTEKDELDEYIEETKKREELFKNVKNVKLGKRYIASWLFKRIVIVVVCIVVLFILIVPPISTSTDQGGIVNTNILETQSIPKLKESLLTECSVYNIDNMTSERASNYRVCSVGVNMTNISPFKIEADGFNIFTCDPTYKDKFIAARIPEGKIEISPFNKKAVTVEILVNISELTEEQLTEAMNSLVIKTDSLWKKAGPIPIPAIPGFVFVSDALEYHL